MASADVHEDVKCSICLNFYTDPVTLNCGHNFCQECIKTYLDTKERKGEDYSCPRCRKRFRERPSLQKNTDLSNIAEKMKSSAGKENRKCSKHNRILELYCTKDSICICVLCMVEGEHRGHKAETLEKAYEKKKKKLRDDLKKVITEREKTERRVRDLYQHKKMAKKHTVELKKKVTTLFKDIRKCLKDLEKKVWSELSRQAELKSISNLINELELERYELSGKIEHLETLNTEDPITLLQDRDAYRNNKEDLGLPDNETCEPDTFVLSMMLQKGLSDIENMRDSLFPVPAEGTNITLDINTAGDTVVISDDRKSAKSTDVRQKRSNPANRFQNGVVLSTREFSSGKHYWMVEGSTLGISLVGMCYPSMRKKLGLIGNNSKSWAIMWSTSSYDVLHKGKHKLLCPKIPSNKVLVYLDYEGGRLSFYELSDPPNLVHTFITKFTEPLHAIFQVEKYIAN